MIPLDTSGFPANHQAASAAAATALMEMVNELPESVYFLNPTDAAWIADTMLLAYLGYLKRGK